MSRKGVLERGVEGELNQNTQYTCTKNAVVKLFLRMLMLIKD